MELTVGSRLKNAWNAFRNRDPTPAYREYGQSYSSQHVNSRRWRGNEQSITTAIKNRIALDVASIGVKHCRLDENGRFMSEINSGLNSCLNLEANIDQTGRAFIHDVVMSMLDEGVVAIVPVDTDVNPATNSSYEIYSMRTGKIVEWFPKHVKVQLYNENTAQKGEVILPKRCVDIIENPLYAVMNEPNSTMQRLIQKLRLLDLTDEQLASGKMDLIIQLPYVVKGEMRKKQAEERRKDVEMQLTGSKYGIAYIDGTEKVTQLNRSLENNLLKQIEYLTETLYSQLGITKGILDGTASEQEMLNYHTRTTEPIISAIVDELKRKHLTKTARSQGQSIMFFRDPFRLVPINNIAEIADKFTRNEIMSKNEFRQIVGLKPSDDPKADQLINSNISQPMEDPTMAPEEQMMDEGQPPPEESLGSMTIDEIS